MSTLSSPLVAIVTGAGQGIGRSIALRLAKDGYRVVLNDLARQEPSLESVRSQIEAEGGQARIQLGDVTSESDVVKLIGDTVTEWNSVDVMVANAGICITKPFLDSSKEEAEKIFSINVTGTFLCYKYAALQMVKQGRGGRIVGAASLASKQGHPFLSLYSSTKFAVRGLTQSAAAELGKYGITVNAYAPGGVSTSMLQELLETRMKLQDVEPPKDTTLSTGLGVLGRDSTPDDVAGVVSFLVSKDASMITGQSISVNGGAYCD
ncbi:NAD(P)-binding protein [Panaeolus papilionaceus]|nr:NAD(P)-binding protein [Panaeolus papilionaceus]